MSTDSFPFNGNSRWHTNTVSSADGSSRAHPTEPSQPKSPSSCWRFEAWTPRDSDQWACLVHKQLTQGQPKDFTWLQHEYERSSEKHVLGGLQGMLQGMQERMPMSVFRASTSVPPVDLSAIQTAGQAAAQLEERARTDDLILCQLDRAARLIHSCAQVAQHQAYAHQHLKADSLSAALSTMHQMAVTALAVHNCTLGQQDILHQTAQRSLHTVHCAHGSRVDVARTAFQHLKQLPTDSVVGIDKGSGPQLKMQHLRHCMLSGCASPDAGSCSATLSTNLQIPSLVVYQRVLLELGAWPVVLREIMDESGKLFRDMMEDIAGRQWSTHAKLEEVLGFFAVQLWVGMRTMAVGTSIDVSAMFALLQSCQTAAVMTAINRTKVMVGSCIDIIDSQPFQPASELEWQEQICEFNLDCVPLDAVLEIVALNKAICLETASMQRIEEIIVYVIQRLHAHLRQLAESPNSIPHIQRIFANTCYLYHALPYFEVLCLAHLDDGAGYIDFLHHPRQLLRHVQAVALSQILQLVGQKILHHLDLVHNQDWDTTDALSPLPALVQCVLASLNDYTALPSALRAVLQTNIFANLG
eukprot:gene470-2445_t